jgi:hypothetical protein
MSSRRFPILTRCTDSIFNRSLEDFAYLPAEAYLVLLRAPQQLQIDGNSRQYLQRFICEKVRNKVVWNAGEVEQMQDWAEGEGDALAGGLELVAFLTGIKGRE